MLAESIADRFVIGSAVEWIAIVIVIKQQFPQVIIVAGWLGIARVMPQAIDVGLDAVTVGID